MSMEVQFPGGLVVETRAHGHLIRTDQPKHAGGGDSAPAPFDLFLASLATCAGLYALAFCRQRDLSTEGLGLALETIRDPERHRIGTIRIEVRLPEGFPEKYRDAILRAVDQCAVKRHLLDPPGFELAVAAPAGQPA